MMIEEAFRVALIPNMRTTSLAKISQKWDRGRAMVRRILAPLALGTRLEFGCDQEEDGRGWFVVRIQLSGQQSLFEQLDSLDIPGCSPDAASARAVLKAYIIELKNFIRQLRVGGGQLEHLVERMPDLVKLYTAFGIPTQDQKRISIGCGVARIEDFALSSLPGRHILPQVHQVGFSFWKLGMKEAEITVPKRFRRAIGLRRGRCTLRWDSSTVDAATWWHFASCLEQGVDLNAAVKVVLKSTGAAAELLLVRFDRPVLPASHGEQAS